MNKVHQTNYSVNPMLRPPQIEAIDDRRYRIRSRRSGRVYEAYVAPNGHVVCSCPAGQHHRECYHARAIAAHVRAQAERAAWLQRLAEIEQSITCRACREWLPVVRRARPGDLVMVRWVDPHGIQPDAHEWRVVRALVVELGHLAIITDRTVPVWCERIADLWRQEVER